MDRRLGTNAVDAIDPNVLHGALTESPLSWFASVKTQTKQLNKKQLCLTLVMFTT